MKNGGVLYYFMIYKNNNSLNNTVDIVPMVTIFIEKKDKILMLKRAPTKKIAPNKWAGIGGHIEKEEYKTPMKACLRELEEETGLIVNDLIYINLKYLIIRNVKDEILREQYVYFGKTDKNPLFYEFSEGKLEWIDKSKVMTLEMPMTCEYILKHYFESEISKRLEVGVATYFNGKESILWNEMLDFDNYKGKSV